MACRTACKVNKHLLPVKASYFFFYAGVASLMPYLSVYMKQLGLSPSETAIIFGILPFLGALVKPLVGSIADKFKCHKLALMICCVTSSVFIGALYFVPPVTRNPQDISPETKMELVCSPQGSWMNHCPVSLPAGAACNISQDHSDNFTSSNSSLYNLQCTLQCDLRREMLDSVSTCGASSHSTNNLSCISNGIPSEIDLIYMSSDTDLISDSQFGNSTAPVCHTYNISNFVNNDTRYQYLNCSQNIYLPCDVQCNKPLVHTDFDLDCDKVEESKSRKFSSTFWIFGALFFIGSSGFAPVFSLLDAMTYSYLGEERGKWGKQRLWGTLGFMVFGVTSGLAMDVYSGSGPHINYMSAFVAYTVFCLLVGCIVCTYTIPSDIACTQMKKNIGSLLRRLDVVCLLLVTLVFGIFNGVIMTFLFWHLQTLGASQLLLGLTMVFSCLFEVPALFYAGRVIQVIGEMGCVHLVCIAYFLRFLGYSLLRDPWWVLAIEPLHCITFGLMHSAVSAYCSRITPPGMHGTIQGFVSGLNFGFGKGCGSLLGGILFENYGANVTFTSQSVAAIVLLVFHGASQVYQRWCTTQDGSTSGEQDPDLEREITEEKEFLPAPEGEHSDEDDDLKPGLDTHKNLENDFILTTHSEPADC